MRIKTYSFSYYYILCVILLYAIQISYGHSGAMYTALSLIVMAVSYMSFFSHVSVTKEKGILYGVLYLVVIVSFIGLFQSSIQDAPMAGVSVVLPFVFSRMHIDEDSAEKTCWKISIINILISFLSPYIGVLSNMNTNSFSFLMFMNLSSLLILFQYKKSLFRFSLLGLFCYIIYKGGSRNAAIIAVFICVVSLLPKHFYRNRVFFRICYFAAILYQVFSMYFMEYALGNSFLYNLFYETIQDYFNKAWGMELRVGVLGRVSEVLWSQNIFKILFGNGVAFPHAHNGFFQATYMYGLFGSFILFLGQVYAFETARKALEKKNNPLVLGAVISLWGILLLQGADVFLFGVKTCSFIPFFFYGILLHCKDDKEIMIG